MESLIPFLKNSSVVDLLVTGVVIITGLILIPAGIWIAIAARRRRPIYFFLLISFLPLLLGIIGTYVRLWGFERAAAAAGVRSVSAELLTAVRDEASIVTYIGAFGTAVSAIIAVIAVVLKKDS